MEPEVKQQYDNYFELFRTQGWKQFIEDMQSVFDTYSIESIVDGQQLAKVQGERRVLNQILNFEWSIRNNFEMEEEESDDSSL